MLGLSPLLAVFVAFCVQFDMFLCVREGIASETHHSLWCWLFY
jgi:hypothetical protein